MKKEHRPKIQIEWTQTDWFLEGLGIAGVVLLLVLPVVYFTELPEIIPHHFNARGEADGFGSKTFVWFLPGVGVVLYAFLTILSRRPHDFNYTFRITPENAEQQYRLAARLVRALKTFVVLLFAYLTWAIIQSALAGKSVLNFWFLIVVLGANFGMIGWYFVAAGRKK